MEWENGEVEMFMIRALVKQELQRQLEEESQAAEEREQEEVVIVVTNNAEPDSWLDFLHNWHARMR